ncbi:hypothetical protein BD289DRAFT_426317 [Coniella lustricola]|uniref:Ketoreductase domain-containing protein n=1 Tax=Coniella lustricola TaxID=2025994 RepID=A0A2T3AGH3_9PEZI|nr:hypothetical protein BD289DRAFT_426317 [Coniella lustricola]
MKIAGRTFVISGGASGLGRATALDLAAHGGYIAILDLNESAGASLVSQIGTSHARFFSVDVTDSSSIASAVKGTYEWITSTTHAPLGGIIPAAGIGNPALIYNKPKKTPGSDSSHNGNGDKDKDISIEPSTTMDALDIVLAINLRGTLDIIRQFLPLLANAPAQNASPQPYDDPERGVIILVSSAAAFDGQMGQVAYAASKGAVASMTLPLARDLSRYGIRAVTIAPGTFETPMTSFLSEKVRKGLEKSMEFPKRGGTAEEFAALVRTCVENVMLNGTVIRLDGGARMPSRL